MAENTPSDPSGEDVFEMDARLSVFGFEPTHASVRIRPRSRRWRLMGAVRAQAVGLFMAPFVGLVPPHAPWALGAVGVGFLLARRRWRHHFSLEEVRGACPRCGQAVVPRPGALKDPHRIPCEACHHALTLLVDTAILPARGEPRGP